MAVSFDREITALRRMTAKALREKHLDVFGEESRSNNKGWLIKRIAWRIQANAEGDLSERARKRAMELANDSDLRMKPPKEEPEKAKTVVLNFRHDSRLPMPGSQLTRIYKGETIVVEVLQDGFRYEGQVFNSLSAVAKAVTGKHWNGYHFFNLRGRRA